MAWPTTLTTNASVLKHVFFQDITAILTGANTYAELHEGAADAVRRNLESVGGIPDADDILNTADYEAAATNWFVWQLLRGQLDPRLRERADEYRIQWKVELGTTNAKVTDDIGAGGVAAKVVVIKQGGTYFTTKRSGSAFRNRRQR